MVIPVPVIALIAQLLDKRCTRTQIVNLFLGSGTTTEEPAGNKMQTVMDWLRAINRVEPSQSLAIFEKLLNGYFRGSFPELPTDLNEIKSKLKEFGLGYEPDKGLSSAEAVLPSSAKSATVVEVDEAFIGGKKTAGQDQTTPVDDEWDVFISYAGEDREVFVRPLVRELKAQSVRVWFDKDELSLGDSNSQEIERGMQRSRYAVVILSRAFIRNAYPDHEYHSLLSKEIKSGSKIILPILFGDISDKEVEDYSLALGDKYHLRASDYQPRDLVNEIVRVVQPKSEQAEEKVVTTAHLEASAAVVAPGTPSDALPQQSHLLSFQPCLAVEIGNPTGGVDGRFYLNWVIRNVGSGAARMIRVFMPGLIVDKLDAPIPTGQQTSRGTLFEDKPAFKEFMRPPVHLILEFEDQAGNIYRQYANVFQGKVPSGAFNTYGAEELGKPWLVAGRIIPATY